MEIQRFNQQTMTSFQIAELTGKRHCDVMRSIRNQEEAWEKVCQRKFALMFNTRQLPNGGTREEPYYELTKTECLYIATKFNDEARAKLVLRWEQLERERMTVNTPPIDIMEMVEDVKRVGKEILAENKQIGTLDSARVPVTQDALILYSYLRRNIPESVDDFPFMTSNDTIRGATGLSVEKIEECWDMLEATGMITRKEGKYGNVFTCGPYYP